MGLVHRIQQMKVSVERLHARAPHLPVDQILASRLLVYLGSELSSLVDQRLRPHGLNEMEFRVLTRIYAVQSTVYPVELCADLGQSPANITRLTDILVERGLITRTPDEQDRRRLALSITAQGKQLCEALLPLMSEAVTRNFQGISPTQLQQLLSALNRLAMEVDKAAASPTPQPEMDQS